MQAEIEQEPDGGLPPGHDAALFQQKAGLVFAYIFDSYWDDGRSVYSEAA